MRMNRSITGYWAAVASVTLVSVMLLAPAACAQVNLPEGFEVVQFEFTPQAAFGPQINDCGEVVWSRGQGQDKNKGIYYYDNGRAKRLSGDNIGLGVGMPDIDRDGLIVWGRRIAEGVSEVVVYRGGQESILGRGFGPRLNNHEQIACEVFRKYTCQPDFNILFYDGQRARVIGRSRQVDQGQNINDSAQIVYMHTDFCVQPWAGDIRLYQNGETQILPAGDAQVQEPHINNLGHVVWDAQSRVELWDGSRTRVLTDQHWAAVPNLNDRGDVYLAWEDQDSQNYQPWLIRTSEADRWYRLADDDGNYGRASLNEWGEVTGVWYDPRQHPASGIWYMRRIRTGDFQFDGDIDGTDYSALARCMSGPGRVDRLCDCRFLDLDHDGDVDLRDFAHFQNAFGGNP